MVNVKKIQNDIFTFVRSFKLKTRLLITFIFLSVAPLLIACIIFYSDMNSTLKSVTYNYLDQLLHSTKLNIDNSFGMYYKKISDANSNIEIVNMMNNYKEMNVIDKHQAAESMIQKIHDIITTSSNPVSIEIINGEDCIKYTPYRITADDINESLLYREICKSNKKISWYMKNSVENSMSPYRSQKSDYIIVAAKISDFYKGNLAGWIILLFNDKIIRESLQGTVLKPMNKMYISDEYDNIFMINSEDKASEDELNLAKNVDNEIIKQIGHGKNENNFIASLENKKFYISYTYLEYTNWKLVSFVKYDDIVANVKQKGFYILLIVIVSIIVAISVTYVITMSVVKPISNIGEKMKQFQNGDYEVTVQENNRDEIAYLAHVFNEMSNKVNHLINEVYTVNLRQTKAELKALQAQINPHFLYNTLDLICWMAYVAKEEDICTVVNSLSTFYRLSLNKGSEYCSIAQEIEHAKSYTKIQEIRYENQISFNFGISGEILPYQTIKLILQPLIENAIYHGIEPNGGKGHITVLAEKINKIISIKVIDDGIGINNDRAREYKSALRAQHTGSGYGLKNVNDRIKIAFGMEYGVVLMENPYAGAISEVIIPAILSEGDDGLENIDS